LRVKVLYFAEMKDITGKNKELFELSEGKITELLRLLFKKYPSIKQLIWNDTSLNIKSSISISINNTILEKNRIESRELIDNDRIAFLLPFSGG